jgi:hypothetical protein
MLIQIKRGRDGASTLACLRDDGSRTWARLHRFFPEHDLTHCAVESVLGFDQAFFGLVDSGWQLDDFTLPALRSRLPDEAILAETIVGLLDVERGTGHVMSGDEFNAALGDSLRAQRARSERRITNDELDAIRRLRGQLMAQWGTIAPGDTLEVRFPYT